MIKSTLITLALILTTNTTAAQNKQTPSTQPASPIQHILPEISHKLLPQNATLKTIASNLKFTEGPLWIQAGATPNNKKGFLIFSDIPANTIYKYSPQTNKTTVFKKPSNKSNGHTLDNQGNLISCNHETHEIIHTNLKNNKITTLTNSYQNKKLNSPNDAAVHSNNTIYFTDPSYGLGKRKKEQSGNHLYSYNPTTKTTTVHDTKLYYPNGLCLSPDEKTLYVADRPNLIYAYTINKDSSLSNRRIFSKLPNNAAGPDGLRTDKQGNLWIAANQGIIILTPNAKHIATIKTPKAAANLTFGGPNHQTLYITQRDKVLQIKTNAIGNKNQTQSNITIGNNLNANRYKNLYLAGQPTKQDFTKLKSQGFTTIINLRSSNEYDEASEKQQLKDLNLTYHNIPLNKLNDDYINQLKSTINSDPQGKILIHCSSGNRAAIWLGGHLNQTQNYNKENSLETAKSLGLTKNTAIKHLQSYLNTK